MIRHLLSGRRLRSTAAGVITGTVLLVITASPTVAAWGGEVLLTGGEISGAQVLRTGATNAIALWQTAAGGLYARRTTTGGVSWTTTALLATGVESPPGASSYGPRVDIAFVKRVSSGGSVYRRVYYLRSFDGGATWGSGARQMTSNASQIADVDVARSPVGQVSIIWTGIYTGSLYMRTSVDSGRIFGAPVYSGRSLNSEIGPRYLYRSDPQLAIGDGVTYVAYTSAHNTASVRNTRDRGAHWSAPLTLSTNTENPYSIVALGVRAVVGYTVFASSGYRATYRRTIDRGTSWSAARLPLYPRSGQQTIEPYFTVWGGLLAVVFEYGTIGTAPVVWHRQTTDWGTNWSAATRASAPHNGIEAGQPRIGGLAILDTQELAGYWQGNPRAPIGYWVRRGP
jgi:hypothetical protein